MEHAISGRLHWDTTHAATPRWMLFIDERPGDAPTMLPGYDTRLPREASHAEVARLIGEMLYRETGHRAGTAQALGILREARVSRRARRSCPGARPGRG